MTRASAAILLLAAAINTSTGVLLVRDSARTRDLRTVRAWGGQWLTEGVNIYEPTISRVDYPPHAIVAFSPLSLVPAAAAIPLWTVLNIGLAVIAPWLAVRALFRRATTAEIVTLTLLFLCWSGTKVFVQFTLFSLVAGLGAVMLAERRPHWSALCLALCATKPQIALPFVLWFAFTGRWLTLAEAVLFDVAAFLLFCIRAGASPAAVAVRYAEILRAVYTGPYQMAGASNLQPLIASVTSSVSTADLAAGGIALALAAAIAAIGFASGSSARTAAYASLALGAVWSLLTFRHLTYGFVLLLPTSALLFLDGDPAARRLRTFTFWALQGFLIVDVPGLWRRVGPLWTANPVNPAMPHFDRLLFLVLMTVLFVMVVRSRHQPLTPAPVS